MSSSKRVGAVAAVCAMVTALPGAVCAMVTALPGAVCAGAPARPKTVMIIRHAEKPGIYGDGVDEQGKASPESLTVRGWTRAGALIGLFDPPDGVFADGRLSRPEAVYAPAPTGPEDSRRSLQTVTPLARRLGISPDTAHTIGEEKELADALKEEEKRSVLVAWKHSRIPDIASCFGHSGEKWPGNRFDLVWVFTELPDGSWSLAKVPQRLLAEDGGARSHAAGQKADAA